MQVQNHFNIQNKHTFGINTEVKTWIQFDKKEELVDYIQKNPLDNTRHLIIGSGSNLLFTKDFDGVIIKPDFKNIDEVKNEQDSIWIKAGAGVIWDDFVAYCVEHQYWGTENLSLIPGCVGASPVQNIGAYGSEAKDIIHQVLAVHIGTAEVRTFEHAECQFAYRNSFFKQSQEWIVLEVIFKLSKKPCPNISYKPLNEIFKPSDNIRLEDIRKVVIETREAKLPKPEEMGNAGSFFKNPVVNKTKLDALLKLYPNMPYYPFGDAYKLAAGWLIDQLGWKGKSEGGASVHRQQALVLINQHQAKGTDVLRLAQNIQKDVYQSFGISLEPEVIIL